MMISNANRGFAPTEPAKPLSREKQLALAASQGFARFPEIRREFATVDDYYNHLLDRYNRSYSVAPVGA